MRSLRYSPRRGGLEHITFTHDEPTPTAEQLQPGEVIIQVVAAGLIHAELFWPMHQARDGSWPSFVVCPDYSGIVRAVCAPSEWAVGDRVMAASLEMNPDTGLRRYLGGASDFVVAPSRAIMRAPQNIPLRDAASIPLCAFTAWQAFHEQIDHRSINADVRVLIAGAGGATGLWAVQVAKSLGAHVTATASDPPSTEILRGLGVDEIVNYKEEDITRRGRVYDLVLDVVGGHVFTQCAQVVKSASQGGRLISLVEYDAAEAVPAGVEAKFFIWRIDQDQMREIVSLIEKRRLKPIIDSYYALEDGRAAYEHAAKGHCHGKVILTLN